MKLWTGFWVIVLVLLSFACAAVDQVDEVKPQITAVFQEKVVLITYFLVDTSTGSVIDVTLVSQQSNNTFVFVPSKSLGNGLFRFTVYASDLVGNKNAYTYDFYVYVPGTTIKLIEPNTIGVANSTTFTVGIYTSRNSTCRYTGISVSSFDDVRLKDFDDTGDVDTGELVNTHRIYNYSVETSFPKALHVVCQDDLGRENTASFTLYSDTTAPKLKSVYFDPSPIVEYPSEGNLSSVLNVEASEPVLCKYTQDQNASYGSMTAFTGFDTGDFDAYEIDSSEKIYFPSSAVKATYTFYIQCEDRARFLSSKFTLPVSVDLSAGLKINVVSPPKISGNTSVVLNVTTNRAAYCVYKATDGSTSDPASYTASGSNLSSSYSSLSTSHYKSLGTRSAGSHSISIRCDVPEGVALEAMSSESEYTYIIDRTPPSTPVVNATTPVCSSTLSASFTANDTESSVAEYLWAVGYSGTVLANGTTSDDSVSVSKHNNGTEFSLSSSQSYIFSVIAVDEAGNVGTAGTSSKITYDSTGITCDTTPPSISLEMSSTNDSVTIVCTDDKSNCTSIGSYYGTSYSESCNTTQYWLDPAIIPLFRTTIICWGIKDNAGNYNNGSQTVSYNLSSLYGNASTTSASLCPSGIDNDGDGYGENCIGQDCDDTDPNITVGCASGCVQDGDGDKYGFGCTLGNDCNDRNANLTTVCPNNCISDNDGDEYGLGCSNGPDCKGDDSNYQINCPNGCVDDNDGDSYGLQCPVGFDCQGENYIDSYTCSNSCLQDTDGDGYGVYCDAGLDCDGGDPYTGSNCTNGCTFDEDGDGYGQGCDAGLDCNGMHPLMYTGCANNCVSDDDGDGYGWGCDSGADCNDTDPNSALDCTATTECLYDHDGDGYGLGCELGYDCDEYSPNATINCTENCTYDADCNGMDDVWQEEYFNSTICNDTTLCGPDADPDGDNYTNIEEYRRGTDPLTKDTVAVSAETPSASRDEDADGMLDSCETMYGLDPKDPYDASKDEDGDGLSNSYECGYTSGLCTNSLNPTSKDTDNDGYDDNVEIDAGTDPCDPDDYPSSIVPLILVILGILANVGSTGYLIYKRYYIPLVSPPPKPAAVPRAAPSAQGRAVPAAPIHHMLPRHILPKKPSGPQMSKDAFEKELQKRAEERERILKSFGERKALPKKPAKVMEEIARRPAEVSKARFERPAAPAAAKPVEKGPDYVSKLSKVVGGEYFDRLSGMTKEEADYFGKLATITKGKEVSLEDDQVSKLANISKKVAEDRDKRKELTQAFRKSDVEELEDFLSSRKHVDTFIKEAGTEGGKEDSFDALSKIGAGREGGVEALEGLSKGKRQDVIDALDELTSKKSKEAAVKKMEVLSEAESKQDILKAFRQMSKEAHVDKNVFEVLLSYLMKSGKITKTDVSQILFDLEKQGVLDKKDISDVFFNLGIKKS
ncbi:hypothetical protein KY363_00440 [Candidatus Woesearchaeota archaeon]|nr:hypothetical protein [Candidatus Woesearchaeota archaeon]